MIASLGLWVTKDRNFPKADPVENTADKWYFAETGHIVKQAFLPVLAVAGRPGNIRLSDFGRVA